MLKRTILISVIVALISVLPVSFVAAAPESNIVGILKDAKTGELLPGANVVLAGTSLGASTDVDGKYSIRNVPPGNYTIRASYIGYEPASASVQVAAGAELKQDFKLASVGVQGEVVVVTAQAAGQNEAINKRFLRSKSSVLFRLREFRSCRMPTPPRRWEGCRVFRFYEAAAREMKLLFADCSQNIMLL